MSAYLKNKSAKLLEKLANSIYDRKKMILQDQTFFFSLTEVELVEAWLEETLKEMLEEFSKY